MRVARTVVLVLVALALAGCAMIWRPRGAQLDFTIQMSVDDEGSVVAGLGVHKTAGPIDLTDAADVVGLVELRDPGGELLYRAWCPHLGQTLVSLEEEEITLTEAQWEGELTPGQYALSWGAHGYGFRASDFEVVERDGERAIGGQATRLLQAGRLKAVADEEYYVQEVKPVVEAAKADLAERLMIEADRVSTRLIEPTEFPDASLGIPERGKAYAQVVTPGYIVKLLVEDGQTYEYHAGDGRVVPAP